MEGQVTLQQLYDAIEKTCHKIDLQGEKIKHDIKKDRPAQVCIRAFMTEDKSKLLIESILKEKKKESMTVVRFILYASTFIPTILLVLSLFTDLLK